MSVAPLAIPKGDERVLHYGFLHGKYRLDYERMLSVEDNDYWEEQTEHLCLLITYVKKNATFAHQYAGVYHDCDVVGTQGKKTLPKVCKVFFSNEVLT